MHSMRRVEYKTGYVNSGQIMKEQHSTESMNLIVLGVLEDSTRKVNPLANISFCC